LPGSRPGIDAADHPPIESSSRIEPILGIAIHKLGDQAMNVRLPNGMVGEIQIVSKDIEHAKHEEGGSKLYVEARDIQRQLKADPDNAELEDKLLGSSDRLLGRAREKTLRNLASSSPAAAS
jgi:hypothetical protein